MIRDTEYFKPGSYRPDHLLERESFDYIDYPEIQGYLDERSWEQGRNVLILGPPGCGKTSLGLVIMKTAWEVEPHRQGFWTEYDYLEDLRRLWRLEEMAGKLVHDPVVWTEYVEWEREFRDRKDRAFLFLDHWCQGYTQNHWYESEEMVRYRMERNLATVVSVSSSRWGETPESLQSLLKSSMRITMPDPPWVIDHNRPLGY